MFAFFVHIVNIVDAMSRRQLPRITVTLPPELEAEAGRLAAETGVSVSDLLRQGMIRVLREREETGGVVLMKFSRVPEMAS